MDNLLETMVTLQLTIQHSIRYLLELTLVLFATLVLNRLSLGSLNVLGIYPRSAFGLPGIIFSPFIHADFRHFFYNLIPLIALTILILPYGFDFYWNISWILIFLSGFMTWLFGRPAYHVGASSLITAYWGLLLALAFTQKIGFYNFIIAFICLYYFFGLFLGIFPTRDRVSWEGHLFGLISGIGVVILGNYFPAIQNFCFEPPYFFHPPAL